MADVTPAKWVFGEISGRLVAMFPVVVDEGRRHPCSAGRTKSEPARELEEEAKMVFAALMIETVVAVVVAGGLATWARKRFAAPRPVEVAEVR
ncbi:MULTISPECIES: hypothetical protein [unclassified Amycolatopsis]|uniref:hypothetical protein n=1 Tax=unclassified Amycolatopsis TaxID=2618356 RepID=UPI001C6A3620|nr:hypothetical protein [Amycolatopsis sp. DSM 110486]QYN24608.1 hypothetical protein K1T34_20515 [Amycolatopsis sp. DSM 110486]